jgi:RNA polymerase sigma-70 factor (ECF subfamily)
VNTEYRDIIRRSLDGDQAAQKALYDALAGKMYGVCLRYASDEAEARDMLQDGFIRVFQSLGRFRFEGSFEGWVRRIIVNTALEHLRKEDYRTTSIEESNFQDPPGNEDVEAGLSAQDLLGMVRELSPQYRMVFNLYAIEGYSHKEISKMLNISEGTSKSNLSRARTILQERIKKLDKLVGQSENGKRR